MKLWKLMVLVALPAALLTAAVVNAKDTADVSMVVKEDGVTVVTVTNPTWLPKTMTAEMARRGELLDIKTARVQPFDTALMVLKPGLPPERVSIEELDFHVWEHK